MHKTTGWPRNLDSLALILSEAGLCRVLDSLEKRPLFRLRRSLFGPYARLFFVLESTMRKGCERGVQSLPPLDTRPYRG